MPTISEFYGITIRMFYDEHQPPHFHAYYAEFEAIVEIETLRILSRKFPKNASKLALEWAKLHRKELMENWRRARKFQEVSRIAPLD